MRPRRAALIALLMGATALPPATARSHAILVRSRPAPRAVVARPPVRVHLWFSERLEPAYAAASVWDEWGKHVDGGDAKVDGGDPSLLSVSTPRPGPGRHTVRFRVLSVDGHVVGSSYCSTVRAGAP